MEFRRGHLRYFVAVAEEGQMTRAARRLHIAQPALSHAIAQLEADVGVELLARHARGVTLTPAGEVFLAKARTAVAAWEDAVQTASSLARERRGTVEFGFVGAAPGLDSPGALEAFSRAHPHIELLYRELPFPSASTAAWLEDVDVAVCTRPPEDPAVWTQLLRREPRAVLVPQRHPLADRRGSGAWTTTAAGLQRARRPTARATRTRFSPRCRRARRSRACPPRWRA
jgi:LysR family hca operon transcriptional activator